MGIRNVVKYFLVFIIFILGLIAVLSYYAAFKNNLRNNHPFYVVFLNDQETFENLVLKLDTVLLDTSSFVQLSLIMNYSKIKPGRYVFRQGMNNYSIINKLKRGVQDPVQVTINNARDIFQLAASLGEALMLDSIDFIGLFKDSLILNNIGYNKENILSLFIPNTYEMYWTISNDRFLQRMINEHANFWKQNGRREKAANKSLSETDVYIISSIVEKETILENEKPTIAGVYLNRLKAGMKLQADPTVVFALGQKGIQRVLLEHLKIESPYNTYLNEGLPPGPICMPGINTIDSVLNATPHEYLFFCAKPGSEGGHSFAKTLEGHYQNALAYRRWLNAEGIR